MLGAFLLSIKESMSMLNMPFKLAAPLINESSDFGGRCMGISPEVVLFFSPPLPLWLPDLLPIS